MSLDPWQIIQYNLKIYNGYTTFMLTISTCYENRSSMRLCWMIKFVRSNVVFLIIIYFYL